MSWVFVSCYIRIITLIQEIACVQNTAVMQCHYILSDATRNEIVVQFHKQDVSATTKILSLQSLPLTLQSIKKRTKTDKLLQQMLFRLLMKYHAVFGVFQFQRIVSAKTYFDYG